MRKAEVGSRFLLVDGLRGVAAMWVVLFHAHAAGNVGRLADLMPLFLSQFLFEWGSSGVAIFFVLSGFVIAHSLRDAKMNASYILRFMVRRSIRLDPPYWFSIILVLSFAAITARVKGEAMHWPSAVAVLAHLGYLQIILGIEQINDVYWTLCYEVQFYFFFCLLLAIAQRLCSRGLAIVFIPCAAVSLIWPLGLMGKNLWPGLFSDLFFGFLAGVFVYWAWTNRIGKRWFFAYVTILAAGALVRADRFVGICTLTALLLYTCGSLNCFGRWLNWRWLQFLGRISYSLYLTHIPLSGASFFLLQKYLGSSAWAQAFNLLVVITICIVFSAIAWWTIERPCIVWGRRLSQ